MPSPLAIDVPRMEISALPIWYRKAAVEEVRIDKWLWAARVFKSRTLAAAACNGGKVGLNDQNAKPPKVVRAGAMLKITLPRAKRVVRVVALSDRPSPVPRPSPGSAR